MHPREEISQLLKKAESTLPPYLKKVSYLEEDYYSDEDSYSEESYSEEAPSDYSSVKQLTIEEELREELQILNTFLLTPETFNERFKQRCQERDEKNSNSCLSIMVMPEGGCNHLYWQIATSLFEPKTNGDILAVMLPSIQHVLTIDATLPGSSQTFPRSKRLKRIELNLHLNSVTSLETPLTQPDFLKHYVNAEGILFDITNIAKFDFALHQQFHTELTKTFPALALKLYQHNSSLRFLLRNLELMATKGQTFRSACHQLIQALELGGARVTGKSDAAESTLIACTLFESYLQSFPEDLHQKILKLKATVNGITVHQVLSHLEKGECVESVAENLRAILNNLENEPVLDIIPHLTLEEKNRIISYYKPNFSTHYFHSQVETESALIPVSRLDAALARHNINNANEYVRLLLSFPPSVYGSLTKRVNFNTGFITALANVSLDIFNQTQRQALNQTLLEYTLNNPVFLTDTLFLAAKSNNLDLLMQLLAIIPEKERFREIIKISESYSGTILHVGRSHPALFRAILLSLEKENRPQALNIKNTAGYTVLHQAAKTGPLEILQMLAPPNELINSDNWLALLTEQGPNGTVLHEGFRKHETTGLILTSLPEEKRLTLIESGNSKKNTVLHEWIKYRDLPALELLLNTLSESNREKALQFTNGKKQTVAYLLKRDFKDASQQLENKGLIASSLFKKPKTPPPRSRENSARRSFFNSFGH